MGTVYSQQQRDTLAYTLRKYRTLAGFSQRDVAEILNMSRSTYTYYETGKTVPDPMTLNRIAKIFGVYLEDFFEEEPGNLTLEDSGFPRNRAPKIRREDPQRLGDLSATEKQIIAYLRAQELSAEDVLMALRKRFDPPSEG